VIAGTVTKKQELAVATQARSFVLGVHRDLSAVERQLEQVLTDPRDVQLTAVKAANALVLVVEKLRRGMAV
jgi:hypothetical protein